MDRRSVGLVAVAVGSRSVASSALRLLLEASIFRHPLGIVGRRDRGFELLARLGLAIRARSASRRGTGA